MDFFFTYSHVNADQTETPTIESIVGTDGRVQAVACDIIQVRFNDLVSMDVIIDYLWAIKRETAEPRTTLSLESAMESQLPA